MKAKNKKWIKSLGFGNLPAEERRTDEERTKNGEERRKTFTNLLTETSRKRYGSTLTWIFFTETNFLFRKKGEEVHGESGTLRTAPFCLFIGKRGRRLPPSSPRRAQLAQVSWVGSSRSNPTSKKTFWKGQFKISSFKKSFWKAQFRISKLLFAPPQFW